MKITFAKAAVIGSLLVLACAVSPLYAGVGWPMRGYDVRNTNASPHYGMKRGRLAWQFRFGGGACVAYARPAVGPDGTIYVVFNDACRGDDIHGNLRALRRDGSLILGDAADRLGRPRADVLHHADRGAEREPVRRLGGV